MIQGLHECDVMARVRAGLTKMRSKKGGAPYWGVVAKLLFVSLSLYEDIQGIYVACRTVPRHPDLAESWSTSVIIFWDVSWRHRPLRFWHRVAPSRVR